MNVEQKPKLKDDYGITSKVTWDQIGSWIARIALLIISFFLFRLINELDETQNDLKGITKALYEIRGDMQVLKNQIQDMKDDIKTLERK